MIGYRIEFGECDFVTVPLESDGIGFDIPAGNYFYCRVSKTKDGDIIGKPQPIKYFKYLWQCKDEIKRHRETIIKNATKGF